MLIKCKNKKCNKEFKCYPSDKRKYCSHRCYTENNKGINNPMNKLENKIKVSNVKKGKLVTWGNKISESLKKSEKAKKQQFKSGKKNIMFGKGYLQIGKLNHNWKGGITSKNTSIRNSKI